MQTFHHIHILGAPGAGTTTLAKKIAATMGFVHLDTDDFYWFTDDPLPYRRKRNAQHRLQLLTEALDKHQDWVLSGSLCGWGDALIPRFDMVIWLCLPPALRLQRIAAREAARYGAARIGAGGDLHTVYEKFLLWAAAYDDPNGRREQELTWLQGLPCPILRFENAVEPQDIFNAWSKG
jgi:adenylate kinase family enzyme